MSSPKLVSVQVGHKQDFGGLESERQWQSAIIKEAVAGTINVHATGMEGDEQVDRVNHGGIDKAILAYSADHFDAWRSQYGSEEASPSIGGAFGENLTVESQLELDVCVGDIFQIGSCKLQVSQPRQPCWKLSRRWNLDDLSKRVQESGRTGWYLRVVEEGQLQAGDAVELIERFHPEWSIKAANDVMYIERSARRDRELAACPALSESWREQLLHRAAKRDAKP
jgi:MOSC domain-containing protein YiiM